MEYTRGGKHIKREGEVTLPTLSVQCQLCHQKIHSCVQGDSSLGAPIKLHFQRAGYGLQAKTRSHKCNLLLQWTIR